jgi:hypothetical protein
LFHMALSLARVAFATSKSSLNTTTFTRSLHHVLRHINRNLAVSLNHAIPRTLATAAATKTRATTTKTVKISAKAATKKPAKSATKKAKAKPKKKLVEKVAKKTVKKPKVLSDKQKDAAKLKKFKETVKALKETALVAPKAKPTNVYAIFLAKNFNKSSGVKATEQVKALASEWKSVSPSEREVSQKVVCNHAPSLT